MLNTVSDKIELNYVSILTFMMVLILLSVKFLML